MLCSIFMFSNRQSVLSVTEVQGFCIHLKKKLKWMLYSQVQELLRSHQSQNANYNKDQEKLGQLHKAEVDSLTEELRN